ncbi:MAG: hypothetical protein AB7G11_11690 [Phycisphaerales bacterium]
MRSQTEQSEGAIERGTPGEGEGTYRFTVDLSVVGVIDALDRAARRGRLPGLTVDREAKTFVVTDFGRPFESKLEGRVVPRVVLEGGGRESAEVESRVRVKPMLPAVFATVLVATVWPGILLTDSMLRLYFSWYTIPTWWWYLPLTVPFCPLAWVKAWRQSKASGGKEGADLMGKVQQELGSAAGGRGAGG